MNLLNNKKIITLIIIIFIIAILLKIFFFPSTTRQIKTILKHYNFTLEDGIYVKQTSELSQEDFYDNIEKGIDSYNETMYFDIDTYELKKVILEYFEGMNITLNLNYSYEEEYISFDYEASENNKNLLFTGKYYTSGDVFECNPMDSNKNIITTNQEQTICTTIEKEVNHFFNESQGLFKNTNLIDKISKLYD